MIVSGKLKVYCLAIVLGIGLVVWMIYLDIQRREARMQLERSFALTWGEAENWFYSNQLSRAQTKFEESIGMLSNDLVEPKRSRFFSFLGHVYLAKIHALSSNQTAFLSHSNNAVLLGAEFMPHPDSSNNLWQALTRYKSSADLGNKVNRTKQ